MIPLILSILSISTIAAPTPQYSPSSLAPPAVSQQFSSEFLSALAAPTTRQEYSSEYPTAPAAPATKKYTGNTQQYTPYTAPAAPASQKYFCYRGRVFPSEKDWLSFEALESLNLATIRLGNKPETVNSIFEAIIAVSKRAKLDPRIVLAIVMQESSGQTFKNGDFQQSSGLMQVQPLNGEQGIRCSPTVCTFDEISRMIKQGVLGTTTSDTPVAPGIAFWLKIKGYDLATALRAYNSGNIPDSNDLSKATDISTASYVSDIGNRLKGLAPENFPLNRSAECGFAPAPAWA